nr:hypothetical protein [Tanacetum cinerariifolium]
MSVQLVELDKHVRDLKNTVLEKDFKIFDLEECVRNKDLEIEKCLESLNVCENKIHKMGQTNQTVHMIMPSKDNLYNGRKGIGFENPSYFEKAKDLRPTLYDEKVIGLGYTPMFLTHSDEALEGKKFKRSRENKIEFAYDYRNLNFSYVNEKINLEDDYFQEIINLDFDKIDSSFQQTSSLKPYVPNVILEKIIIDLEDEVVNILEKEKANLETIESLKSKGFESSENASSESENQTENDCLVVEKECDKEENPNVIASGMFKLNVSQCVSPILMLKSSCDSNNVKIKLKRKRRKRKSSKQIAKQVDNDVSRANNDFVHFSNLDTFSSVRRPKNSGVMWKKKGSSNTSNVGLSAVSVSNLNKNVKRYSRKDLLCDVLDDNNFFIFDDENVRISPVNKMPFRKKPRDSMHIIDSGCSKHMMGNHALLMNFVEKFLGTVRFGNNDFVVIAGYGDVVIGSMTIKKVDEGFLVGYFVNSKAFRVFNRIGPKWLFDIDTLTKSMSYQPVVAGNHPNENADDDVAYAAFDVKENENVVHVSPSGSDKNNNKKHNKKTKRDDKGKSPIDSPTGVRDLRAEFEEFSYNSTNRVNAISAPVTADGPNPTNITNTASPYLNVVSPNFGIAVKSSFVDPSKYLDDLNMPELEDIVNQMMKKMNKARLVAQGHTQEECIDYDEVFAHVAKIEAIRLFLAYASFMGCMVYQMDIKSAFHYETIEEEVYGCQPLGFEDLDYPDKVYKVVKTLYGLHQAPRAWNTSKAKKDGIFISQDKYVAEILRKFGFTDVKLASTLIETEKPLLKNHDGEDVDVHIYRSMIGSLMYLTSSRPDIMFAVCSCARF